jgi:trigger factor
VKRKVLPPLEDDFAKELGSTSLDELRARLRAEIENRLTSERTAQEKEQLIKQLIAQHTFQVPPSMVEREFQDVLYRLRNQDRFAGSATQEAASDLKAIQEQYRPVAEDRAKGRILLQSIAEQEGLSVGPQELDQEIALMAKGMRTTPQEMKNWILSQQGSLEGLKTKMLERKALEFIHSKAIFVEN